MCFREVVSLACPLFTTVVQFTIQTSHLRQSLSPLRQFLVEESINDKREDSVLLWEHQVERGPGYPRFSRNVVHRGLYTAIAQENYTCCRNYLLSLLRGPIFGL